VHGSARPSTSAGPGSATLVGGTIISVSGSVIVLTDASGEHTIELAGPAVALAATLEIGDLVNATGFLSADGRLIVDDPGALVRVAGLGTTHPTPSANSTGSMTQAPPQQAAQPPQIAPVVAFGAIFGLTVALAIGAFALRRYGPNRLRNWRNRLKSRKPAI
jgi:hypothetical protein